MIGALGGVGMRSGVPSLALALGSSMKSEMDGKGRTIPGLSGFLRCSNTAATAAATITGAGAATATGGGLGAEEVGEITFT